MVEIKVLGPLTATERGVPVLPSAAKPRQVLALLALQANRVVTMTTLMEELWGGRGPRTATTTLQHYIFGLRRMLAAALGDGGAAKSVLATWHGGYLLRVPPGHVDAQQFEDLAAAGRAAFDTRDYESASRLLGTALGLWRGPALVDVPVGSVLELEVVRLEQDRMAALERRIESDLQLGRHLDVVPELRVLVARNPMHEGLCAQLMIASHRSGTSWHALEAYRRLRGSLSEGLGLEPSPKLQRLQRAVLTGDPALELAAPAFG